MPPDEHIELIQRLIEKRQEIAQTRAIMNSYAYHPDTPLRITLDRELSQHLSRPFRRRSDLEVYRVLMSCEGFRDSHYVVGALVDGWERVRDHAWLELKDRIVDPSTPWPDQQASIFASANLPAYFPAFRYTRAQLCQEAIIKLAIFDRFSWGYWYTDPRYVKAEREALRVKHSLITQGQPVRDILERSIYAQRRVTHWVERHGFDLTLEQGQLCLESDIHGRKELVITKIGANQVCEMYFLMRRHPEWGMVYFTGYGEWIPIEYYQRQGGIWERFAIVSPDGRDIDLVISRGQWQLALNARRPQAESGLIEFGASGTRTVRRIGLAMSSGSMISGDAILSWADTCSPCCGTPWRPPHHWEATSSESVQVCTHCKHIWTQKELYEVIRRA